MTYQTITVHLDDIDNAPALLTTAVQLSEQHNSHLIGHFIMHPLELYVARISAAALSDNISELINKHQLERMLQLETLFREHTANQRFQSEWRFIENKNESVFDVLMRQAGTSDILIIGHDRSTKMKNVNNNLIEKTLLDSPVPTLVVPNGFQGETLGQHVMAGWDATTVSRRAITAALPFLKNAENVWVHEVTDENNEDHFEHSIEIELASMLARHGVNVELSASAGGHITGDSLLEEAKLHGADLLVAGAFGHQRIRDIVLGSTTKYLLEHSHLPLLMMH